MEPLVIKNGIKAPKSFFELTKSQLAEISNGCGPAGWGLAVPDKFRIAGVDFTPACDPHDYMYHMGYPKNVADLVFEENTSYCATKARCGFRTWAQWAAYMYYLAVKNGGAGAYNRSK